MSKIGIASASKAALIDLFSFRRNVHYFKIFYSNKPGAIQLIWAGLNTLGMDSYVDASNGMYKALTRAKSLAYFILHTSYLRCNTCYFKYHEYNPVKLFSHHKHMEHIDDNDHRL